MTALARASEQRRVGLLGYPLGHTISPVFQQAALDFHGIPARYEAWETSPEELATAVAGLRPADCLGANVTIPHKQAVMPLIDELDPQAAAIGAVNTIVNRAGRLRGHNTDVGGMIRALRDAGQFEPAGKRCVVVGAGGVARAAVFGLLWHEAESILIVNRTVSRSRELAAAARLAAPASPVTALEASQEELGATLAECDLLVNASSVGMLHGPVGSPVPVSALHPDLFVYDLVYNPAETELLADAHAAGARSLGGLAMLVYQGAEAFEFWTGLHAPVGLMMKRAADAMGIPAP